MTTHNRLPQGLVSALLLLLTVVALGYGSDSDLCFSIRQSTPTPVPALSQGGGDELLQNDQQEQRDVPVPLPYWGHIRPIDGRMEQLPQGKDEVPPTVLPAGPEPCPPSGC